MPLNTDILIKSQVKLLKIFKKKTGQKDKIGIKGQDHREVFVAQQDRVLASDAKGCEFEPRRVRQ